MTCAPYETSACSLSISLFASLLFSLFSSVRFGSVLVWFSSTAMAASRLGCLLAAAACYCWILSPSREHCFAFCSVSPKLCVLARARVRAPRAPAPGIVIVVEEAKRKREKRMKREACALLLLLLLLLLRYYYEQRSSGRTTARGSETNDRSAPM